MGRVGGWGGLNVTQILKYCFIKFYQNRDKIAKVWYLGGFWVVGIGEWGGLNMAQHSYRFILVVSL